MKNMTTISEADFLIVGAGSAGCAVAGKLAQQNVRRIAVLEAGPTDRHPLVQMPIGPFGLIGGARDWAMTTIPQRCLHNRRIPVPRGKMIGGSSSINGMVWFRGRRSDFDAWSEPVWSSDRVWAAYEAVENAVMPARVCAPHAMAESFAESLSDYAGSAPTPEYESSGLMVVNIQNGMRRSAADAFLYPELHRDNISVHTGCEIDRLDIRDGRVKGVISRDGDHIAAHAGLVLCAGAIASPAILMRSGIGPADQLMRNGIDVLMNVPEIGRNLHDHPAVTLYYEGPGSGYGLTMGQLPAWATSPILWALGGRGRLASNMIEAGAFFRASAGQGPPDCQSHFFPIRRGYEDRLVGWGSGYSADVGVCRPQSRGQLVLADANPAIPPEINFNMLQHPDDLKILVAGVKRLRELLDGASFGGARGTEVMPGRDVSDASDIAEFVRDRAGTSYHPVGTVRLGSSEDAPLTPELALRGVGGLWVADASVMPSITSANTNAPSMMIGLRAAGFISKSTRR